MIQYIVANCFIFHGILAALAVLKQEFFEEGINSLTM